jgi:hypothetical protein
LSLVSADDPAAPRAAETDLLATLTSSEVSESALSLIHARRRSSCAGYRGHGLPSPPSVWILVLSTTQLERLHAGLVRLAALPGDELQAVVESLLAEKEDG